MQTTPRRPVPVPTPLTEPFWTAARDRVLAIQCCTGCRRFFHPPTPVCLACHGHSLAFEPVSGRGRVHARTIMYDARVEGFGAAAPYAVVAIELDEQPGLLVLANMLDIAPEDIRIGARVEVDFEPMDGGFLLPQFRVPRGGGDGA